MNKYLPLANDQKINQHNRSGLDQFDKFVSLAHFLVRRKRTTAHLRTPFHYFQLTSRAITVSLLLPSSVSVVVLWVFSGWRLLVKERKPEKSQRTTANSRHTTLRAQPFSRTYCYWRFERNVRVSNLDTLLPSRLHGDRSPYHSFVFRTLCADFRY